MNILLALPWIHFVADFVCQTDWMAQNKSKDNRALGLHIVVYSSFFMVFGWQYAVLNGLLHAVVDYFTSRFNSKMWAEKKVHLFFVGVGFDQAVHFTCLIYTAHRMLGA